MKYDKNLIKIIEDKNFKTFWHCLDYLLMAGYSAIDSFGISLKHFGENKIFDSVAFIRHHEVYDGFRLVNFGENPNGEETQTLVVGFIDDTNIHLSGLYTVYRDMLTKNGFLQELDIEETCETLRIKDLGPFIINYLIKASEKHFGFKAFKVKEAKVKEAKVINLSNFRPRAGREIGLSNHEAADGIGNAKMLNLANEFQNKINREQL